MVWSLGQVRRSYHATAKNFGQDNDINHEIEKILAKCHNYLYFTTEIGSLARSYSAMANGVSDNVCARLKICTDEIVSNILFYSEATRFSICCESEGNDAHILFSDNGKKFNPLTEAKAPPNMTVALEKREIGGLGIYMVKKMMKSATYRRNGAKNEFSIRNPKT